MNLAVGHSTGADVYVENNYGTKLSPKYLEQLESLDWVGWFQHWLIYLSDITDIPQECELSLKLT
ncbi:MAG: hypothetical protein AAFO95_09580, partial [Cyanobacteria bacterium J06600_6]